MTKVIHELKTYHTKKDQNKFHSQFMEQSRLRGNLTGDVAARKKQALEATHYRILSQERDTMLC